MTVNGRGATPAFVVFGDDWGRHVSTMQHLFGRIAAQAPVVWLNAIGHREPGLADLGRAWAKGRAMLRGSSAGPGTSVAQAMPELTPPLEVVQPRVLPWHGHPVAAAINRRSLHAAIARAVARHRLRDFVLVTGSPPSAPVIGECGERASIYFCMDDFLVLPGTSPRMLAPLERELLRRVDAVVATAQRLVETKVGAAGRGYHLPQGVNFAHFATRQPMPAALRELPRPIVGFAGGVGNAVDVATLHAIADAIPGASIVLVGPVTLPAARLRVPGVHVLGPRPYGELPAWVQAFDVGIIPYVENDWTRAVDPLKLLEYLAAGVPVVASPLPEVLKYRDAVRVAPLGAPFAAAVREVLAGCGAMAGARARAFAARHTWEQRAGRFLEIVEEVVASREAPPAACIGPVPVVAHAGG